MGMIYSCEKCGQRYQIDEPGRYQCSCGFKFDIIDSAKEPQAVKKNTSKICMFCQGEIPVNATKCMHCGEWVSGNAPKSKAIYFLLAIFTPMGIHEIYWGNYGIAISIMFGFLSSLIAGAKNSSIAVLLLFITGIIYLASMICVLMSTPEDWAKKQKPSQPNNKMYLVLGIFPVTGILGLHEFYMSHDTRGFILLCMALLGGFVPFFAHENERFSEFLSENIPNYITFSVSGLYVVLFIGLWVYFMIKHFSANARKR